MDNEGYSFWFWLLITYFSGILMLKLMHNYWWIPRKIERYFLSQGISGPKYHFLFGNLREIGSLMSKASSQLLPPLSHNILPRVLSFYHHWSQIHGATFLVWFGQTARLTITDPDLIKDIFVTKSEYFEKIDAPPIIKKLEGDGLLNLRGQKWAHRRKLITPTFHHQNLKLMMPMMRENVDKMLTKWSELVSSSGDVTRKVEIDVSEWFQKLAEDVIIRTAFGSSYEEGRVIFQLQAQQMAYATEAYQKVFNIPGYRFLPTKKNRNSWKLDKEIRRSLLNLIQLRRKNKDLSRALSEECPKDLLELMIKATGSGETMEDSAGDCRNITDDDIIEESKTILFAGKHTTSKLLTWTTILLAMHPEWQELAREEVFRVCGSRDPPSADDIHELRTVGMIISESLRLYPPTVATIRRSISDVQLGHLKILTGTELLVPIIAVHHNPCMWGPDANEFKPTRFTKGVSHAASHSMAFMPFGLGSRRCIGQNLATLQAKLVVAMILQSFSFDLSPNYKHAPSVQMLLYPQYGAPIIFKKL